MDVLREWLDRPEGGDFFLRGREADIWEEERDVIALAPQQAENDCLTRWIGDTLVPCTTTVGVIDISERPGRSGTVYGTMRKDA